jgi:hypothetical protein
MNLFKAFSRVSKRSVDGVSEANKNKTLARIGQINKTVCRRGMNGSINCSPYTPCYDVCPVFTPPPVIQFEDEEDAPLQGTAPKSRAEIIAAIRDAGSRNSRIELMRIVSEHPLDFATAMAAFRDGLERNGQEDRAMQAAQDNQG